MLIEGVHEIKAKVTLRKLWGKPDLNYLPVIVTVYPGFHCCLKGTSDN